MHAHVFMVERGRTYRGQQTLMPPALTLHTRLRTRPLLMYCATPFRSRTEMNAPGQKGHPPKFPYNSLTIPHNCSAYARAALLHHQGFCGEARWKCFPIGALP